MNGPRVLMVGGHIPQNQFVRQAETAGCIVEWHDGRPGKSFPKFCDALICAKYQLSHEGFWAAKEAYKGKPTFIADHSWSTIKDRFDSFVREWKEAHPPKKTIISQAMEKAMIQMTPQKQASVLSAAKAKGSYSPGVKAKVYSILKSAQKSGLGPSGCAEKLNEAGITRSDGKKFTNLDASNWLNKTGYKAYCNNTESQDRPPIKAISPSTQKTDKLVYELILSANLGAVETTALMRRCMDGRLTQNEALKFIELYTDLKETK